MSCCQTSARAKTAARINWWNWLVGLAVLSVMHYFAIADYDVEPGNDHWNEAEAEMSHEEHQGAIRSLVFSGSAAWPLPRRMSCV